MSFFKKGLTREELEAEMRKVDENIRFEPDMERINRELDERGGVLYLTSEQAKEYGMDIPPGSTVMMTKKEDGWFDKLKDWLGV